MTLADRPRLRPYLAADQEPGKPGFFLVTDRVGISRAVLRLTAFDLECIKLCDGRHGISDIRQKMQKRLGNTKIPDGRIEMVLGALDQALFLDGPEWNTAANAPVRPPSCIGCYEGDPAALTEQMNDQFHRAGGPGALGLEANDHRLNAILVPHIDYNRGGFNFAHGFKALYEQTNAKLFVIIGTSHHSPHLFTLTRKAFQTPLGIAPVDNAFMDRIESIYGEDLYQDELLGHLPEHSIELEVVFLQHILGPGRPFRIVPMVVGSFHHLMGSRAGKNQSNRINLMAQALQHAETMAGEPVCYVISGDLAHIGPKFGDPSAVSTAELGASQRQDLLLMKHASAGDHAGYLNVLRAEEDSRRICGFPPTYLTLLALGQCQGKLLRYDQYVHPRGHESVSFASMAFHRAGTTP